MQYDTFEHVFLQVANTIFCFWRRKLLQSHLWNFNFPDKKMWIYAFLVNIICLQCSKRRILTTKKTSNLFFQKHNWMHDIENYSNTSINWLLSRIIFCIIILLHFLLMCALGTRTHENNMGNYKPNVTSHKEGRLACSPWWYKLVGFGYQFCGTFFATVTAVTPFCRRKRGSYFGAIILCFMFNHVCGVFSWATIFFWLSQDYLQRLPFQKLISCLDCLTLLLCSHRRKHFSDLLASYAPTGKTWFLKEKLFCLIPFGVLHFAKIQTATNPANCL